MLEAIHFSKYLPRFSVYILHEPLPAIFYTSFPTLKDSRDLIERKTMIVGTADGMDGVPAGALPVWLPPEGEGE